MFWWNIGEWHQTPLSELRSSQTRKINNNKEIVVSHNSSVLATHHHDAHLAHGGRGLGVRHHYVRAPDLRQPGARGVATCDCRAWKHLKSQLAVGYKCSAVSATNYPGYPKHFANPPWSVCQLRVRGCEGRREPSWMSRMSPAWPWPTGGSRWRGGRAAGTRRRSAPPCNPCPAPHSSEAEHWSPLARGMPPENMRTYHY